MAIDRQRILNELGNVVNQLQNADCGCMNKIFAKQGNPLPTCGGCRRGTCPGHGYHVNHMTGSGDPYGMGGGMDTGGGMQGGMGMHGGGMGTRGGGMGMHGGGGMGMHDEGMGMHGGGGGMGMHGGGGMGMHGGGGMGMHGGGGMGMHGGGMGMHGGGGGMGMHGGGGGMGMRSGMDMQGGMEMQDGGGMGMSEGGMDMGEGGMGMGGGKMGMGGGGMGMQGGGMGMQGGGMGMGGGGMYGRNAPKLYADTYSYLNKNLMQPVMQEVYNDLKSITPENTVGNNPLAAKMGLPMNQGGAGAGGMTGAPGMAGPMQGMGGASAGTPGNMGHMGAQMVNMMMSSGRGKTPNIQSGNLGLPGTAEQQPADMGMTNMNPAGGMNPNQPESGMPNSGQGMMQNPVAQYVTGDNMQVMNSQSGDMPQGNTMNGNPAMQQMQNGVPAMQQMQNGVPAMQQNMGNMNPTNQVMTNPYGKHSAGINKFNEMFPGVKQEGLDFDPMAIAMQMNPANQQQTALNQITKLMTGNRGMMQSSLAGANAASGALGQTGAVPQNQIASQPGQSPVGQTGVYPGTNQQVYAAQGNPGLIQQIPQQQIPQQQIPQEQIQIDPNTGAPIMPTEGVVDPNAQIQGNVQEQQNVTNAYNAQPQEVYYNTLGQPIQMLPPSAYQTPIPSLPQTLGGSGGAYVQRGYGIKNTMSKTSLARNNMPVGPAASKSQLQHIYRQYRASHSQQNFRPPATAYTGSHSLAQLNTAPVPAHQTLSAPPAATAQNAVLQQQMQQPPVERVGGDTIANNQQLKVGQPMAKMGDVPPSNLQAGDTAAYQKVPVMEARKDRNGLQDLKFANYHQSAAWSFHG